MEHFKENGKEGQQNSAGYLSLILGLTALIAYLMAGMIDYSAGNFLYSVFWLACFCFFTFNIAYMLVTSFFYLFVKTPFFPESSLSRFPSTAVIYPVKNEGEGLYERMRYSLLSSKDSEFDCWLLSDSDRKEILEYERDVIKKLQIEFGVESIRYRRREKPVEKKQGNIMQWIHQNPHYRYFFVCDADTMIAPGTLRKLAAKAEHPSNRQIGMFQCRLEIVHAKTYFARFQAVSARMAQNLYVRVNQAVFGRQVSFGHGVLIRSEAFLKLRLPEGVWSHDIWDTVLFDQMGWRTVFCHDCVCYDEVPAHYLELVGRNRRWARGTMQSWPLLFLPEISLASRFYVAYGIYMYVVQPVFLCWILSSFWAASSQNGSTLLEFQRYAFLGGTLVDIELVGMGIFSLGVVFLHKLVLCRSFGDVFEVVNEILLSTLLCLNNVFYQTLDLMVIPFQKAGWLPVKKDPFAKVTVKQAVKVLWPSTLLGISGIYFGLQESPSWTVSAAPFLISFSFIIPLTFATSQEVIQTRRTA